MTLLHWLYIFIYCTLVPVLVWPGELRLYGSCDTVVRTPTVISVVLAGLMTAGLLGVVL